MNYAMMRSVIALVAGVSILAHPRVLNYMIAFFLIAIGILGLLAL